MVTILGLPWCILKEINDQCIECEEGEHDWKTGEKSFCLSPSAGGWQSQFLTRKRCNSHFCTSFVVYHGEAVNENIVSIKRSCVEDAVGTEISSGEFTFLITDCEGNLCNDLKADALLNQAVDFNKASNEKKGLSTGAIIGIVIGSLVAAAAILVVVYLSCFRRSSSRPETEGVEVEPLK